ncbi:MAG: rhodanese-like domain-containing protein [Anaerolineales bacterium]|nr:rhodanese-like domain-containing protein [Anaerolineales bacterium]WKZ40398.1 MAG: rhodanese-like domain-containing protein [Anaerolineales bacterium]
MKRSYLIVLIFFMLVACQPETVTGERVNGNGGSYQNIAPNELSLMLKNKDFVLVNVHIPFTGNIPDTDLSIPYNQISVPEYLNQLPADKDAMIVLYCRSGRMSEIAATELVSLGYTNIWNFNGGMVAWEQAGYQIEQ